MPRLYSGFPGKASSAGLLLLRMAIGGTVMAQIACCASGWQETRPVSVALCLLAIASGASLVFGFLTRIAAVMLAILAASVTCFSLVTPSVGSAQNHTFGFNLVVIAVAIAMLGPGAFSLDALLFGRRKVIIPRSPVSSKP